MNDEEKPQRKFLGITLKDWFWIVLGISTLLFLVIDYNIRFRLAV